MICATKAEAHEIGRRGFRRLLSQPRVQTQHQNRKVLCVVLGSFGPIPLQYQGPTPQHVSLGGATTFQLAEIATTLTPKSPTLTASLGRSSIKIGVVRVVVL
jgi:hypothetical protein